MNRFRWFCLLGFLASLVIWALPVKLKPYHLHWDFEDYKILFVEHDHEYGFAANGLIYVHTSLAFEGSRPQLDPIRQDWIVRGSRSKKRWPTSSLRPHYDEWGPSHSTRDDGVELTQVGVIFCVPYSVLMLMFGVPLVCAFLADRFSWLRVQWPLAN